MKVEPTAMQWAFILGFILLLHLLGAINKVYRVIAYDCMYFQMSYNIYVSDVAYRVQLEHLVQQCSVIQKANALGMHFG